MERPEYADPNRINENILLETEIERKNFTRAAHLAASLDLTVDTLKRLQAQALCRMAATYRNSHGTKALAQQYGYSNQEVKQILEECVKHMRENRHNKALKACYDCTTGKYLTFEEWLNHYIENWPKL